MKPADKNSSSDRSRFEDAMRRLIKVRPDDIDPKAPVREARPKKRKHGKGR